MITHLWNDEEINGRIWLQTLHLFQGATFGGIREPFFHHVSSMMHKLHAVKYHLKNYLRIEREQYEWARRAFKKNPGQTREAFELIFELDAFLVQVKSSLDMLAKVLNVVVGKGVVTRTFGDQGNKLIKGLSQYKCKSGVRVQSVDDLIALIKEDRDSWLNRTITLRDRFNHTEALRDYKFLPVQLPNGDVAVKKPSFGGNATIPMMELIYHNNLDFHQDFIAVALSIAVPRGLDLARQDADAAVKIYNHESARHIKFTWAFTPSLPGNVEDKPPVSTDSTQ